MDKDREKKENPNKQGGKPNPNKMDGIQKAKKVANFLGGLVSAGKGVIDIIELIKQHPEWYTHYDSSNLIALNLADKQNTTYRSLKQTGNYNGAGTTLTSYFAMPSVAANVLQLTTPTGDRAGWRTGIRLLYQQLRTANSGRINFTVQDLEKYVLNVRALIAIDAFLNRTYQLTYTFRSTNSSLPEALLMASGLDTEDIMMHAADLFMYLQRFHEQIKVSFPLRIPLFDRTRWLFANVFVDSNSHKPSFYVPTIARAHSISSSQFAGGLIYHTSESINSIGDNWTTHYGWRESTANSVWTYDQLIDRCEEIKNTLLDDALMSVIAGDIIKGFGDKSFCNYPTTGISEGMIAIFDKDALSQFQNENILGYAVFGASDTVTSQNDKYSNKTVRYYENQFEEGWILPELLTQINSWDDALPEESIPSAFVTDLIERNNSYLLNWHDNKIDPGHVMSITRLVPTQARKGTNAGRINYGTYGTEVAIGMWAVNTSSTNLNGQLLAYGYASFAGNIIDLELNATPIMDPIVGVRNAMFVWANFDWAPRIRNIGSYQGSAATRGIASLGPDTLDWDVFADADENAISLYLSYGNQSLLYAGASQNQSNRKVYRKQTGKQTERKQDEEKSGTLKEDKA